MVSTMNNSYRVSHVSKHKYVADNSAVQPRIRRLFSSCSEQGGSFLRRESSTVPAVAAPLLEMGFSLKNVLHAIAITKSSGEVSAHTINVLASWMLEHPTSDVPSEPSTSLRNTEEDNAVGFSGAVSSPPEEVLE